MDLYCVYCAVSNSPSTDLRNVKRKGTFCRTSDGAKVSRIQCRICGRTSSGATQDSCRNQNKRQINELVRVFIASAMTQRRCARILKVDKKTIARKVEYLGRIAEQKIDEMNREETPITEALFDDQETFERSKKLPLSVILLVRKDRKIIGLETAQMPARGKLAKAAREKYGKRKDTRKEARRRLFARVASSIHPNATFESDRNPHYPPDVKAQFPHATHITYKSRNARAYGFGELKEGAHDPLFALNHTAAMFRANLACLARKTWTTTKKQSCLRSRLMIFALYQNQTIDQQQKEKLARMSS